MFVRFAISNQIKTKNSKKIKQKNPNKNKTNMTNYL